MPLLHLGGGHTRGRIFSLFSLDYICQDIYVCTNFTYDFL
jgi:hypothetical protein